MSLRSVLFTSSLLLAAANASPMHKLAKRDDEYIIDTQGEARPEFLHPFVGSAEVSPGAELSYTTGQTIESSFEVGADLGLDFGGIISAGVSVSVTQTAGTSTEVGTTQICPDDLDAESEYTCAIVITPNLWQVNGHVIHRDGDDIQGEDQYTATFPTTSEDGFAKVDYGTCICPNADGIFPAYAPDPRVSNCPGSCN